MTNFFEKREASKQDQRILKRCVLLLPFLLLVLLQVCCTEATPTRSIGQAPELTPLQRERLEIESSLTTIEAETFDAVVDGWLGWVEGDAVSEASWDEPGYLLWSVDPQPEAAAALAKGWPTLVGANGLTIRLNSYDRAAFIVLGVQEEDESTYGLVLPIGQQQPVEFNIPFEGMSLLDGSEDENGMLDRDQLSTLILIDIAGFLAAPTPNTIAIDEIVLWEGSVPQFDLSCASTESSPGATVFRTGVDANYIPMAEERGHGFFVGDEPVDPLELFARNGVDSFRVRLWVGDEGESGLAYATELTQRVQDAGLDPYLVIFLSEYWSDVNKQPLPEIWSGLSLEERAERIQEYSRQIVNHFIEAGVDFDLYEIGNEIDYGISGVYADTTQARDPDSLRESIWPDEAYLIRAAVAGVREADPEAEFMLHIATAWDPDFAVAFYTTMTEMGVDYDYVGLSLYPSAFGLAVYERFCVTLDRLSMEIGKPIIVAETGYPAEPFTGGPFKDWSKTLPGYPLTPEGQAFWITDFLASMRARNDVVGVYIFGPDFWFSGEIWSPFALFDHEGRARPGVGSFSW
jgi:arabinogalactan endo-1,4-beta-galactosidase